MNRILAFIGCLLLLVDPATAQSAAGTTWIFLADKPSLPARSVDDRALEWGITRRALERRAKALPADRLVDTHDQPVSPSYLRQIEAAGAEVVAVSRWLNAVSVKSDPGVLARVATLPFVRRTQPVASLTRPESIILPGPPAQTAAKTTATVINYGPSLTQLQNITVPQVHELGIDGSGVIVGMIDNGFNNHRSHEALRNITILHEYDFIHRLPSTQRYPWESFNQGNHGTLTLSALAGHSDGDLVGPAYGSSLILAKTEMDSAEVRTEEDLYVEALEWMELLGADIVSTSLGYIDWYTYDSLDGITATTSRAARIAASKGVLLVTAMGNEGWFRSPGNTGTLIAPADADSIIAVGATHSDGEIAAFSSTGPTFDGRVKPEVVAQGAGVYAALGSSYAYVQGTSLSTPLVAGAAALVLSAQRDLTPMQVREALIATAQQIADQDDPSRSAVYPNNYYGHGMIDTRAALTYHGVALGLKPGILRTDSTITVSIFIVSDVPLVPDSLAVMYQVDPSAPFQRQILSATATPDLYSATLPVNSSSGAPSGYFTARDQSGRSRTSPYNAPAELHTFVEPRPFSLHQNYPNPFNTTTTILFDAPGAAEVELTVYDLLGRKVKTIYRGLSWAGANIHTWRGDDDAGRAVSSGLYIVRIHSSDFAQSRKVLLIR